ncbi:MAG: hypothetical protein IAE82_08860 [Opitutaceae bacterium]|nr:hypothetical protein [Opitutaceae bacterium]
MRTMADVQRAIALDPFPPSMPETIGFMLKATGQSAKAAAEFERAAQAGPDSRNGP